MDLLITNRKISEVSMGKISKPKLSPIHPVECEFVNVR